MSKFGINNQSSKNGQEQRRKQRGATMVEYALIVAAIAIVAYAGASLLGGNVNSKLSRVASSVGT